MVILYTASNFNKKSKRLDLSYQNIQEISKSIGNLENLRMLNLSRKLNLDINALLELLPNPSKLEVLILDSLNLKTIPQSIQSFSKLKQLSLAYNPQLNLETAFDKLKQIPIKFLNLKGNSIKKLPQNITNLNELKDLNLSFNKLHEEKSYSYLGKILKLYSLWIDNNTLNKLPKTIGNLQQLRCLYINNNNLYELPEEIVNMKKLWIIHAGYNKFKTLPELFIKTPSLLMVHINNNISYFPRAYETEKYAMLALLLDNNPIPEKEKEWAEKTFKRFFLLSFKQTY